MKEVSEFGNPKKEGWYWLFFPYHYSNKPILCKVEINKTFGNSFYYEWNDIRKEMPITLKLKSWKSIPEPKNY